MAVITSKYIDIPGMNNTRDLGGMRTKDGHVIRPHMLYRSSKLRSLRDPDWFIRNVELVVDMRSSREVSENPDPHIPGVGYLHLPIFEVQSAGITRDRISDRQMAAPDPETATARMAAVYTRFVTDEFSLSQYRRFIRLLFEPREKALLWHCSAGKDRTGIGALFIQELLGVSRDDIMADYLITNKYIKDEVRQIADRITAQNGSMDENAKKGSLAFLDANEKYPLTVYAEVQTRYGSFDSFIREGLGVSDSEREYLKQRYLEQTKR